MRWQLAIVYNASAMARSKSVLLIGLSLTVLIHDISAALNSQEYEFSYWGRMKYMATEMPLQNPGFAFRSAVRLQQVDQYNLALKLEDFEIASINSQNPKIWQNQNNLKFERNMKITTLVERPFMMKLVKTHAEPAGLKFHQLEVPALDPLWSVNLKKSLASLVNVFLPTSDVQTYASQESTILGDCIVFWNVQQVPHWKNPTAKVLNLSRVINLDECTTVPYKIYGSLKGSACENCQDSLTHPLASTSRTTYSFVSATGNRSDLILEEVKGLSELVHSPYMENGNIVKLLAEQNLQLKSVKKLTEKFEIAGDKEIHWNLTMIFAREKSIQRKVDLKSADSFVEDWDLNADEGAVIAAMRALANLNLTTPVEQERSAFFRESKSLSASLEETILLMRVLDYATTEKVFEATVAKAPSELQLQMQSLFVEVTALAGHSAGLRFLMDKFQSGNIETRFVDAFLKSIHTGLSDSTETALEAILRFCQSNLLSKLVQEKKQCLLVYSSLVRETCRFPSTFSQYNTPECSSAVLQEQAFRKLVPDYDVATGDIDQMEMFIQIAGNLATRQSVDFLLKVIDDKSLESLTKLGAARALGKIMPKHLDIIQKQAAKVYLDKQRPTDLRILSSILLFKSKPSLSVLQTLADTLVQEENDQVRSFVVSVIKEIDSNDYPCFRGLHQDMRYIAPMIAYRLPSEWKRKDFLTSHLKLSTSYDPEYDIGSHSMLSVIMTDSYVPREISFSQGQYFANFFFEAFSIVVRQQGLDSVADFIYSPRTMGKKFGSNLWNVGGKRRFSRRSAAEMDQLASTLNTTTKKYDPKRLEITLGAFGHTLSVISLNESHFVPFMSAQYTPGTVLNNILSTDIDEIHYSKWRSFTFAMPTSLGLPAYLDIQMPAVMQKRRKNSSFSIAESGTVTVKLNQHVAADISLQEVFGFDIPAYRRYIGMGFRKNIKVNIPLHLDMVWRMPGGKITSKREIGLPQDLIEYSFYPFSYLVDSRNGSNTVVLDLFNDEEQENFDKDVQVNGVNLRLKGSTLPTDPLFDADILGLLFDTTLEREFNRLMCNPKWIPRKLNVSALPTENSLSKVQTLTIEHKMTLPSAPENSKSGFTKYTVNLPNSFTHVIRITTQQQGERDVDIEIRYSFTPKRDIQWFQVFYGRKLPESERNEMCFAAKIHRTLTDWSKRSVEHIKDINLNQRIQVHADFSGGKECDAMSTIHFNATYEHSEQQKKWLNELASGISGTRVHALRNPYIRNYQLCLESLAEGLVLPTACHKFIIHTSQLNQMTLEISGAEFMELQGSPLVMAASKLLLSKWAQNLKSIQPVYCPTNRILLKSTVREPCIDQRLADIELEGFHYKMQFNSTPVSWGAHWAPKTATHLGFSNMQSYSRLWYNRYCDHDLDSVRTFDRVKYNVPETTCWKLMAQDCSEQKLFTILTRSTSSGKKDIKVLLDIYRIAITHTENNVQLKLNGAGEETLEEAKPRLIKNEHGILEFVVIREGPVVIINAPIYGLYVLSHTSSVFIQVAPFYRNKLCGLCGNFDLNGENDFQTTNGCRYNTPLTFAQNFVIPDSQCVMPSKAGGTEISQCA